MSTKKKKKKKTAALNIEEELGDDSLDTDSWLSSEREYTYEEVTFKLLFWFDLNFVPCTSLEIVFDWKQ